MALAARKPRAGNGEVSALAFAQTAATLVPANPKDLMTIDHTLVKRAIVPISAADVTRAFLGPVTYNGGAVGDDVTLATSNSTDAYSPRNQLQKANLPGSSPPNMIAGEPDFTLAVDITRPRGWLEPDDPYVIPPASPAGDPTITSLSPNTAVSVTGPDVIVTITGTNYTQWSTVTSGGFPIPFFFVSPTKLTIVQKPRSSVAGVVQVVVTDHGVASTPSNFTFT
jgi:hypothetical protein